MGEEKRSVLMGLIFVLPGETYWDPLTEKASVKRNRRSTRVKGEAPDNNRANRSLTSDAGHVSDLCRLFAGVGINRWCAASVEWLRVKTVALALAARGSGHLDHLAGAFK